jgi:putative ABC transport system permease protein
MHDVWYDLRYTTRIIRKNRAFSSVVVFTLALGIGANTLVYSMVDGVVLNPFPYPEPDRLVGIGSEWPRLSEELNFWETLSPAEYRDVKDQSATLEDVVMWDMGFRSVSTAGEGGESLFSGFWFDNVFPTLAMRPAAGRGFSAEELERGDPVAVVSFRYWQSRLAGDPDAIGRALHVEGEPYTLIGVMPRDAMIYAMDLWIPMGVSPDRFPRGRRAMQILARIKAPYTLEEVNAELEAISGRIEQEYGAEFTEYVDWRMQAMTWTDVNVRLVRPAALAMMAAVGFVLLIACANIASLMLARTASRRKEFAVRRALGAGRGRILRQLLTESVVLSGIGGVIGVGMTFAAAPLMLAAIPDNLPIVLGFSVNGRALAFTAAVTVLAGIILGLAPALQGSRDSRRDTVEIERSSTTAGAKHHRLQQVFVAAEFAVALVLLVQAGLMTRSFIRMQAVDAGFDTDNILTMRITLPRSQYSSENSIHTFFDQLAERLNGLPAVRSAGVGSQFPPITFARRSFAIEGRVYQSDDELPNAYFTMVDDRYHEALGIPLVRGRMPSPQDTRNTPIVAVINEAAARRFFPNEDPIGRRLRTGTGDSTRPFVEVVGVVASVSNRGPDVDPQPELYASIRQVLGVTNQLFLVIRAERDAPNLLASVQQEVAALDPDQPVYAVRTVSEAFATLAAPRRAGALTLSAFGAFALLLAATGIYSVVSYGVSERTREIGLRMAIGASGPAVRRLIVRQAMLPVVVGGLTGLVAALAAGRAVSHFLFETSGTDVLTVATVTVVLAGFAAIASYVPARRASGLSPTVALRE